MSPWGRELDESNSAPFNASPRRRAGVDMTTLLGGNGWVRFDGGVVVATGPDRTGRPADAFVEDLGDKVRLLPGFVDLQVNGIGAVDFATAADEHVIAAALDDLAHHGTTACLPTIVTAPLDAYDDMLDRIRRARDLPDANRRCAILGVHLEGPFLGGAPGAHPQDLLRTVDLEWLTRLLDRHGDLVRMVTLAPEADPGFAGIRMLAEQGVVVALGHSTCSYDDAIAAADAGARAVTHLVQRHAPDAPPRPRTGGGRTRRSAPHADADCRPAPRARAFAATCIGGEGHSRARQRRGGARCGRFGRPRHHRTRRRCRTCATAPSPAP